MGPPSRSPGHPPKRCPARVALADRPWLEGIAPAETLPRFMEDGPGRGGVRPTGPLDLAIAAVVALFGRCICAPGVWSVLPPRKDDPAESPERLSRVIEAAGCGRVHAARAVGPAVATHQRTLPTYSLPSLANFSACSLHTKRGMRSHLG